MAHDNASLPHSQSHLRFLTNSLLVVIVTLLWGKNHFFGKCGPKSVDDNVSLTFGAGKFLNLYYDFGQCWIYFGKKRHSPSPTSFLSFEMSWYFLLVWFNSSMVIQEPCCSVDIACSPLLGETGFKSPLPPTSSNWINLLFMVIGHLVNAFYCLIGIIFLFCLTP